MHKLANQILIGIINVNGSVLPFTHGWDLSIIYGKITKKPRFDDIAMS